MSFGKGYHELFRLNVYGQGEKYIFRAQFLIYYSTIDLSDFVINIFCSFKRFFCKVCSKYQESKTVF